MDSQQIENAEKFFLLSNFKAIPKQKKGKWKVAFYVTANSTKKEANKQYQVKLMYVWDCQRRD
jgi:hypothetical protein